MRHRTRHPGHVAAVLAIGALVAASCSSSDGSGTANEASTSTVEIEEPTAAGPPTSVAIDTVACTVDPGPNEVSITTTDDRRVVESNGIPDHLVGEFPNPGNPNAIEVQAQTFEMSLTPAGPGEELAGEFGVALNGVAFDPNTAEFWDGDMASGWRYDALGGGLDLGVDCNLAHVQPNGEYHYHGPPTGLVEVLGVDGTDMALVGWAADGHPLYYLYGYADPDDPGSGVTELSSSYRLKEGERPDGPGGPYDGTFNEDWEYVEGSGDLDECNGRSGVTPEFPDGTYYYVITETHPFIGRCFVATPDESFALGGPDGAGGAGGGPPPP